MHEKKPTKSFRFFYSFFPAYIHQLHLGFGVGAQIEVTDVYLTWCLFDRHLIIMSCWLQKKGTKRDKSM